MSISYSNGMRSELDDAMVRQLASLRGHPVVTSFYLDVDGRRHPRPSDLARNADHLSSLARQLAVARGPNAVRAVDADLRRVHDLLTDGIDRSATRGFVAISSDGTNHGNSHATFEAFALPVAVQDQVAVEPVAALSQLCDVMGSNPRALAVVVDRRRARLIRLELGRAAQEPDPSDEEPRQVDTNVELGGFQPFEDEAASRHLRAVAAAVADELRHRPADTVVAGGLPGSVAKLRSYFTPDVAMRLVPASVTVPATATTAAIAQAVHNVLAAERRRHLAALLDELSARAGQGLDAAAGLPGTLEALGDRRVGTLVVERGFHAPGGRCRRCGLLVLEPGTCRRCGSVLIEPIDVVEAAVAGALGQGATVVVADEGDMAAMGSIGVLERNRAVAPGGSAPGAEPA